MLRYINTITFHNRHSWSVLLPIFRRKHVRSFFLHSFFYHKTSNMYIPAATIFMSILALSSAGPIGMKSKRALTAQSYADFQISDGEAGNAVAEVNAKFPLRV
jgi:hypothetical protein